MRHRLLNTIYLISALSFLSGCGTDDSGSSSPSEAAGASASIGLTFPGDLAREDGTVVEKSTDGKYYSQWTTEQQLEFSRQCVENKGDPLIADYQELLTQFCGCTGALSGIIWTFDQWNGRYTDAMDTLVVNGGMELCLKRIELLLISDDEIPGLLIVK